MLDISTITPAPGAGKMTPEQLLSPPWKVYGDRVLLGAGLLDRTAGGDGMHSRMWREDIDLERLDMSDQFRCMLAQLSESSYNSGCSRLGFSGGERYASHPEEFKLGFNTCPTGDPRCDPVSEAFIQENPDRSPYEGLTEAWLMYLRATRASA